MTRNLVLCLDGTAGQVRGDGDSNSVRLYDLLDHTDESAQVAYYDPGVGTFSSPGAWTPVARALSRLGGLIYGAGLRENLGDAYLWLMRTWKPGDRIFIFGFSRGAFTARALTGMLRLIGLMRPGSENQLQYAVSKYARRGGERQIPWDEIHRFSALFAQQVEGRSTIPVHYLGLWDTVKALGVVGIAPDWPYTRRLPNAAHIRHAISIDERRRPFSEYVVQTEAPETLEEAWFAGVHSDVGGTFADDPRLSTIALKWVLEGAVANGLRVDDKKVRAAFKKFSQEDAAGRAHANAWIWNVLIPRRRPVPPKANVHASVRDRMARVPGYRPELPGDAVWVDEEWATVTSPVVTSPVVTPR